ncbi:MAG: bifunctional (p)ppGpp synthetase/guanosine-3',5'-bis(diphosphate) 3'-pyrophosphohydrolase [Desulfotignum sp.]|nr:bifunctional (p)ppGpp synthetase/guanosine-3',5'-bis(diphosphate) 3'-pyrophosphohydrolase [Desulfotignum sp.]MCF8112546.1 bifunctional (p)ppGpp synthetase/guanosine-3',5'-bis(diphosphate) 3'-pyrophosphohydrolase [Desulfotignum sp.]MCF8126045.1 bifunctional (p)ppGpp synthetase/guanosine-3',5'-bis(diphosphate) 3'-pyrophosphohydrolase [Desulfotignum sp.]
MIRITDIQDTIVEYNSDADLDIIDRAYVYSARVHDGQVRLSGEPYLSHPLEVAQILAEMRLDVESIAAALLHDVIEDTPATKEDIQDLFGPGVAHIVEGVTKLSALPFSNKVAQQAESLRKMILAMADDIRVVLIKLADRLHNMRTLKYHNNPEKQAAIAQETLDIYAPIAARLGIFWVKHELEEAAFFYTLPDEYERIDALVNRAKNEKEEYIKEVSTSLHYKMEEMELPCDIKGRYKQHYSIYQKMISQSLDFDEVYDIIAFRIILDTVPQCYAAMGAIHSMWKPIYYKIKDYIGNPKPNMYQSIHTTVIGPKGERVEIQIRTHDMDRIAESGIAAHWSYKEGTRIDEDTGEMFAWIRNLVENQENFNDPDEFLENVRIDLYPDEIYVITPAGEIKTLPKGATPVDFAYRIHTEVGAECTGAKVNGKIVPLAYELKTGDTVEVITTKGHTPSPDWLSFVKTVKARTKIRAVINAREKERSYSLGREMCEKLFRKKNQNFNSLVKSGEIREVADTFGFKSVDDLIAHVGFGKLTPMQILNKALPHLEKETKEEGYLPKIADTRPQKSDTGIIVKGLNDILVKFSKCCNPLPGDPITGYITQGQGVTIHRKNCINIMKMSQERLIEVQWSGEYTESYPASIRIKTDDRFGLLADIASVISKSNANILNAKTETSDTGVAMFYFTIMVESSTQLRKIMSALRRVKKVIDVKRILRYE